MESKKYNKLNKKKRSKFTNIENKPVVTSREREGKGTKEGYGEKGVINGVMWDHVCEIFENCKAL